MTETSSSPPNAARAWLWATCVGMGLSFLLSLLLLARFKVESYGSEGFWAPVFLTLLPLLLRKKGHLLFLLACNAGLLFVRA